MDVLPDCATAGETLTSALIDSRERWRDFALLAADLVFEMDAEGRLTFLAPDPVLGHPVSSLIGRPATALLAGPGPGPFGARQRLRDSRAWLTRADRTLACFTFSLMPHGAGLRGVGRDVTTEERMGEVAGRALRRATALGWLFRLAQRQAGAEEALEAMMAALPPALACAGAALLAPEADGWRLLRGERPPPTQPLSPPGAPPPDSGRLALAATSSGPALLAWRGADQPLFDADDRELLAALAQPLATLLLQAQRQRELTVAAEVDVLTGLLNRRGFDQALEVRLVEPDGGTLVFLDLDGLKPLNDRLGHEAGDAALRALAGRLAETLGPRDLAGRFGGDEFCLWLHGASAAAAAQRAAPLGAPGPLPGWPQAGPFAVRASLGLAVARPGEPAASLIQRADLAMYAEKRGRSGGLARAQ